VTIAGIKRRGLVASFFGLPAMNFIRCLRLIDPQPDAAI